jgi:hypothetical protein
VEYLGVRSSTGLNIPCPDEIVAIKLKSCYDVNYIGAYFIHFVGMIAFVLGGILIIHVSVPRTIAVCSLASSYPHL